MFSFPHSDGVQRQICMGDVIVILRPWFTKISFPLRILLGTFLARVLQSDPKAQISSHDIIFHEILTLRPQNDISVSALLGKNIRKGSPSSHLSDPSSRGLACLGAFLAIRKRFFFRTTKSHLLRALAWRACFSSLFLSGRLRLPLCRGLRTLAALHA